jgi:hypothetical protein
MEDQFYGAGDSRTATRRDGAPTPTWKPIESTSPWPLASQIRQLLGEDCELDPSFFEESWTSGLPAAVETSWHRRDEPEADSPRSGTFAELNRLGTFFFSQADAWQRDGIPYVSSATPTASYTAGWLQEPLEESNVRIQDEAPPRNSTAHAEYACERTMLYPTTYQRACELLSVSKYSTGIQIKAAYRRMVSQWHPDRLEHRSETVRELATQQMAAINEAYRLLRSYPEVIFS